MNFNLQELYGRFREALSNQWRGNNKGGFLVTAGLVVYALWWILESLWPYLLLVVLIVVGIKLYMRFMAGYLRGHAPAPPPKVTHVPKAKVVTMPQTSSSPSSRTSPDINSRIPMKVSFRLITILVAVIVVVVLFTRFLIVIPAGTVGVYSLFGKVSANEMNPGLNLVNPLGKVEKMSIRTEQYTMSVAQEEGQRQGDDSIDALSKEGLQLKLDITVLYSLQKDKASDVYSQLGREFAEKVIRPEIRSAIREVVAQYDANAVYSEKRTEMTSKISDGLKSSLLKRGITVEDVLLRNVILPAKLSDSIQEKLQADQEQQRYDFVLQKEEKEAERKRIEAAGQRDAQKIITDGLTPNYLNYLYIQNLKDNKGTIYVPTNPTTGLPLFKGVGQ